jgi:hypothetical protein
MSASTVELKGLGHDWLHLIIHSENGLTIRLYPRNVLGPDRRNFGLILQLSTLRQITKAPNGEQSRNCERRS